MKYFNLVFIFLFIISAGLQYNDPDPYVWIPVYLFGAYLCYQAFQNKFNPLLYYFAFSFYSLYALYLFFNKTGVLSWATKYEAENIVQTMKATKPWIEETREFGGLLILLLVLAINFAWFKKQKKKEGEKKLIG